MLSESSTSPEDAQDEFGDPVELEVKGDGYDYESVIGDSDQAKAISERIFEDSTNIIRQAAKIRRKIDGIEPPYSPQALKQEGKSWKSNVNTGFMQTITGKVAPRLYMTLDSSRYLIASALPAINPLTSQPILNHATKTEFLRHIFTKTVREWTKWHPFIVGCAEEVSNFGHCYAAYTDDIEWRPTLYRLDQAQTPTGTELLEENIPFFVAKDEYLIHELFEKIANRELAKEEGWDIDAVVEAINQAVPSDTPRDGSHDQDYMIYEDLRRELVPAWSYRKGAKTIEVRHVFGTEIDGRVTQVMLDHRTGEILYRRDNRYRRMADVLTPLTFNYGNGRIHGCYGLGQMIYDLAIRVEKARNQAIDNIGLRGKIITTVSSPSELKKAKTIITDENIILAGQTAVGNQAALPAVVEDFINLDRYYGTLAEQKIGAFLPPPLVPGASRTATEASIAANREDEVKRAILEFWLKNAAIMMHMMARRMFNTDTIDRVAQEAQQEALTRVSMEEMILWANQPPRISLMDFTEARKQEILQFAYSKTNNPFYNQYEIEKLQSVNSIGAELTDAILIEQPDQNEQAVAAHAQIIELTTLQQGTPVPILPTDNDIVHIAMLRGEPDEQGNYGQGAIAQALQSGNQAAAQAMIQHYEQHVAASKEKGTLGEQENQEKAFGKQLQDAIQQITSMQEQQMEAVAGGGGQIPQTPQTQIGAI